MVLRGQPVGEQGAADRWTALDPHPAGSGAAPPSFSSRMRPQGPAGFKSRRLAAQFSPYRSAEGPAGPFFHAAVHLLNVSPVDLLGLRNPWECRVTIVSSFNTFAFVSF